MISDHIPKTEIELENWMKTNCYNFNGYSVRGSFIHEGYGIEESGGLYSWFYTERGQKDTLKYFKSESDIIEYAYNKIKTDKWANAHCIGFSTDLNIINELKTKLQIMKTDYFEDKIPYYGFERSAHRVFVIGCDIHKTEHLKEKYWTEK